MNRKLAALLCLTFCFGAVSQAHAYLDPGIGTYTFQILIAGLMAAAFTFNRWWNKLLGFFSKRGADPSENAESGCEEMADPDGKRGPQV